MNKLQANSSGKEILLEGKSYLSLKRAAALTGYHSDYLGRLVRKGKLEGRRIGYQWFIEKRALSRLKRVEEGREESRRPLSEKIQELLRHSQENIPKIPFPKISPTFLSNLNLKNLTQFFAPALVLFLIVGIGFGAAFFEKELVRFVQEAGSGAAALGEGLAKAAREAGIAAEEMSRGLSFIPAGFENSFALLGSSAERISENVRGFSGKIFSQLGGMFSVLERVPIRFVGYTRYVSEALEQVREGISEFPAIAEDARLIVRDSLARPLSARISMTSETLLRRLKEQGVRIARFSQGVREFPQTLSQYLVTHFADYQSGLVLRLEQFSFLGGEYRRLFGLVSLPKVSFADISPTLSSAGDLLADGILYVENFTSRPPAHLASFLKDYISKANHGIGQATEGFVGFFSAPENVELAFRRLSSETPARLSSAGDGMADRMLLTQKVLGSQAENFVRLTRATSEKSFLKLAVLTEAYRAYTVKTFDRFLAQASLSDSGLDISFESSALPLEPYAFTISAPDILQSYVRGANDQLGEIIAGIFELPSLVAEIRETPLLAADLFLDFSDFSEPAFSRFQKFPRAYLGWSNRMFERVVVRGIFAAPLVLDNFAKSADDYLVKAPSLPSEAEKEEIRVTLALREKINTAATAAAAGLERTGELGKEILSGVGRSYSDLTSKTFSLFSNLGAKGLTFLYHAKDSFVALFEFTSQVTFKPPDPLHPEKITPVPPAKALPVSARPLPGPPSSEIELLEEELQGLRRDLERSQASGLKISGVPPPTLERIIESRLSGLSSEEADKRLALLNESILLEIAALRKAMEDKGQANFNAIALSQRVDRLSSPTISSPTISNATVSTIHGLTDADIPDDITLSRYLGLGGGTLSGNLSFSSVSTTTIPALQAGSWVIATSSADIPFLAFDSRSYRIGLGTTTPGRTLSVAGDVLASGNLNVGGSATSTFSGPVSIAGILTANANTITVSASTSNTAQFSVTRAPQNAHTFSVWAISTSEANVKDASLLVNPLSAAADTNLFGIAVADGARFLIDAEGDVFANSVTLAGGSTLASTTISGTLTIEGNTTLGDAPNNDTTIIHGQTSIFATTTSGTALRIWNSNSGGDLLRLQTGVLTPTTQIAVSAGGQMGVGTTTYSGLSQLTVGATTTASIPLTLKGVTGQTANLFQILNSLDSQLLTIDSSGNLGLGTSTPGTLLAVHGGRTVLGGDTTIYGTTTVLGLVSTSTATSTFAGGVRAVNLDITGTAASSTFANGLNLSAGCFAINGTCVRGQVTSVTNSDSTLTISPTTGDVVASLNLANANVWTGLQRFNQASSTRFSVFDTLYVGGTATSTIVANNATSTFAGGIASTNAGGLSSTNGLTITGGSILNTSTASSTFSGTLDIASSATSTFSGGLKLISSLLVGSTATTTIAGNNATSSFAGGLSVSGGGGLASAQGLTITGGNIVSTVSGTSTVLTGAIQASLLDITSTSATSTFANGIQLSSGCFRLPSGSCAGTGGGTGTPGGSDEQVQYNNGSAFGGAAQLIYDDDTTSTGIASTSPWALLSVEALQGTVGATRPIFAVGDQGTTSPFLIVEGNRGFVGVGTSSPFAMFSVAGNTVLDANRVTIASTSASTLTIDYRANATTTIADNSYPGFSWTIATSTTQTPIFRIQTFTNRVATTSVFGNFEIDSGAFSYNSATGTVSIDRLEVGPLSFDTDAGIVSWVDLPVATTTTGTVESYTASIDGTSLLTVYGETEGTGAIRFGSIGVASTTPWGVLSVESLGGSALGTRPIFVVGDQGTTSPFLLVSGRQGNVGVGTSTPGTPLSVQSFGNFGNATSTIYSGLNLPFVNATGTILATGDIRSTTRVAGPTGSAASPSFAFYDDTNTGVFSSAADNLAVTTGGTQRWDIDATDMVFTVPARGAAGSASAPTYSFSGDSDSGMYNSAAGELHLGSDGATDPVIAAGASHLGMGDRFILTINGDVAETVGAGAANMEIGDRFVLAVNADVAEAVNAGAANMVMGDRFIMAVNADVAETVGAGAANMVMGDRFSVAVNADVLETLGAGVANMGVGDRFFVAVNGAALSTLGAGASSIALGDRLTIAVNGATAPASAANDIHIIAGATDGDITFEPGGTGDFIVTLPSTGDFLIQDAGTTFFTANDTRGITIAPSTSNIAFNLDSTGDFVIQDAGTTYVTFDDTRGITFAPSTSDIVFNLDSTGDFVIQDAGTSLHAFTDTGVVGIASTTPWGLLSVEALQGTVGTNVPIFVVGDQGTTSPLFLISGANGFVGIGTSTPRASFALATSTTVAGAPLMLVSTSSPTGPRTAFAINSSGQVAIGAPTTNWTLRVQGGVCISNDTACPATEIPGGLRVDTAGTVADDPGDVFDIAERYPASEEVEAGDIVALDLDSTEKAVVKKAVGSDVAIGVASRRPALAISGSELILAPLAEATSTKPLVALAGRVHAKVSLENGLIMKGDRIALSSMPGVGAKATTSGMTIGIALESYDGRGANEEGIGKVLVFVNLGYARLDSQVSKIATGKESAFWSVDESSGRIKFISPLDLNDFDIVNVRQILGSAGTWSIDSAGKLAVQEIETEKLKVKSEAAFGSPEKRIGITIYDEDTGEPYCLKIKGGQMLSIPGKCGTETFVAPQSSNVEITETPAVPVASSDPDSNQSPGESSETAPESSSPPSIPEPAPPAENELVPSGIEPPLDTETASASTTPKNSAEIITF